MTNWHIRMYKFNLQNLNIKFVAYKSKTWKIKLNQIISEAWMNGDIKEIEIDAKN